MSKNSIGDFLENDFLDLHPPPILSILYIDLICNTYGYNWSSDRRAQLPNLS